MNNELIEKVLIGGDLSKLNEEQRLSYYQNLCVSLGLNPLTKPFQYMNLGGKLVLYAGKDCTEQLRKKYSVSVYKVESKTVNDIFLVTANAKLPDGREDASTGAVAILGLKGDALANAFMKAETKAKRRVTLSICGLGMLDETELETIPEAKKAHNDVRDEQIKHIQSAQKQLAELEKGIENYVIKCGKKYKGKKLREVAIEDLWNHANFYEKLSREQNRPLNSDVKEFIAALTEFTPPDFMHEEKLPF